MHSSADCAIAVIQKRAPCTSPSDAQRISSQIGATSMLAYVQNGKSELSYYFQCMISLSAGLITGVRRTNAERRLQIIHTSSVIMGYVEMLRCVRTEY